MKLEDFEKCLIPPGPKDATFFDWFAAHSDIPFGIDNRWIIERKDICLKDIYDIWTESNRKVIYFWFNSKGDLDHAKHDAIVVSSGHITVSKKANVLYRDSQINEILK